MSGNPYYSGPRSDHFDGERFFNPDGRPTEGFGTFLRWRLTRRPSAWPEHVASRTTKPAPDVAGLRVTMVGHSSVLLQTAGCNLLVDPVWSERVSPVAWAGPRRVTAPGIAFDDLPRIDGVLLTHCHYDHCDLPTLRRLWNRFRPRIVAPLGNDAVIAKAGDGIVVETFDWGGRVEIAGVGVTLHPARHWSARTLFDRRMALWCGFVVESPAGVAYLSGDTGYGDGSIFRALRSSRAIDVAVLPIGAYAPRWFMAPQHVDPDEAVRIMLDCGAAQALGVHWGTFPLADEGRDDPPRALAATLADRGLPPERFRAMEPGDVWGKGLR